MSTEYFDFVVDLTKKLGKFFTDKRFNHGSLLKTWENGSASVIISQIKDSDFFLKANGMFFSHGCTVNCSVDTGKSYYAKLGYTTESSNFSAKANIFSEKSKRTGSKDLILPDAHASIQTNFKFNPFSISLGVGLQYDKNISLASLLNVGKNQYLINCVLSDKGASYSASLMTKLGIFGNFSFKQQPFIIKSISAGFVKEFKQIHGLVAFDAITGKMDLSGVLQASDYVSFAVLCSCDMKQKQACLKLGTLVNKDAKLRATADMRGNVDMDVVIHPKDWLTVTLSSSTNITRAEPVNFGMSLDFNI